MILWITGISGTGKTTLGTFFLKNFKKKYNSTIHLDGDLIRNVYGNDVKYTLKARNTNAERLTKLVKHISSQKINIIVTANLTSLKYRTWCKKNLRNYLEIYISAELKNLLKRDYKNLYKNALNKKIKNVVGIDIPCKHPKKSDLYIANNSTKKNFLKNIKKINHLIKKKKITIYK